LRRCDARSIVIKTSIIRFRVADFLKQYAPFSVLSEPELLALASSGRVLFHESDEYIFRQGQPIGEVLWVIQQGSVEIIESGGHGDQLRDLLEAGDLLGFEADRLVHQFSAKTASDVILYSIDFHQFAELAAHNEQVARFLSVQQYGGATDEYKHPETRLGWLSAATPPVEFLVERPDCDPPSSLPGLSTGDYFLQMMRHKSRALSIEGLTSPAQVITDEELALAAGFNPAYLADQANQAKTVARWSYLLGRWKAMLAAALVSPSDFDLCAQMGSEFLDAITRAIIRQVESEMDGEPASRIPHCWMVFGKAGRSETALPQLPELGIVYQSSEPEAGNYFVQVLARTQHYLIACGLVAKLSADAEPACHGFVEWQKIFREHIEDPIGSGVHRTRSHFDLRPLAGEAPLVEELKQEIARQLARGGPFVPVLSNDTLSNLPPLTFFQGLVVELDGAQRETLDLAATAIDPIVDAARVFSLAGGHLYASNTLTRLEQAAVSMPLHSEVLRAAAQAFRIAAYQQVLAELKEVPMIRPARLSRYDQRLLKSAFDAIQRLLEVSSTIFDVAA
jgi:signal-transduction protein with cAMP-binding, CBS, and nucleotidyltransferase domain